MGANISRYRDVNNSSHLKEFVGDENLDGNNTFFDELLGYNLKPTRNIEDIEELEAATQNVINEFVENNPKTKNFNHLIANILTHQIKDSDEASVWRAFNGLNFVNYIIKSLIKEDDNLDLIDIFDNVEDLTSFVNYLVDNLIEIDVSDLTYHILLVSTTLLVNILMYSSANIQGGDKIIPKLLQKYIDQQPAPVFPFGQTSSIGYTLASGMWSVMTVGMSSLSEKPDPAYCPLATVSLALLLFLTKRNPDNTMNNNREILARLTNNDVNLSDLHYTLLTEMNYEGSDQLFQRLLVENFFYRRFVVVATDLSTLVLPLLESIYHRNNNNTPDDDKSIRILRILSMDPLFCQAVHSSAKVNANQVTWYKDKAINNMTLGSFIIIVLLRAVVQANLTVSKEYLQKHYLTVLSNMSGHFRHLSPYVSERIISTVDTLRKKHNKLAGANDIQSAAHVEEVLATLLFLTNNCLVQQTEHNPNLIYTLLYKRDILEKFGDSKLMKNLIENFRSIVTFVDEKIEKQTTIIGRGLQPEEVLDIAANAGNEFPKEKWITISILNSEEELESDNLETNMEATGELMQSEENVRTSIELSVEEEQVKLSQEDVKESSEEILHTEQQDDVKEEEESDVCKEQLKEIIETSEENSQENHNIELIERNPSEELLQEERQVEVAKENHVEPVVTPRETEVHVEEKEDIEQGEEELKELVKGTMQEEQQQEIENKEVFEEVSTEATKEQEETDMHVKDIEEKIIESSANISEETQDIELSEKESSEELIQEEKQVEVRKEDIVKATSNEPEEAITESITVPVENHHVELSEKESSEELMIKQESLTTSTEIEVNVEEKEHIEQGEEGLPDLVKVSIQEEQPVEIEKEESELCKELSTEATEEALPEPVEKDISVEDREEEIIESAVELSLENQHVEQRELDSPEELMQEEKQVEVSKEEFVESLTSTEAEVQAEQVHEEIKYFVKGSMQDEKQIGIEKEASEPCNEEGTTESFPVQLEKDMHVDKEENIVATLAEDLVESLATSSEIELQEEQQVEIEKEDSKEIKEVSQEPEATTEIVPVEKDIHVEDREEKIMESSAEFSEETHNIELSEKESSEELIQEEKQVELRKEDIVEATSNETEEAITESITVPVEKDIYVEDKEEKIMESSAEFSVENQDIELCEKVPSEEIIQEAKQVEVNKEDFIEALMTSEKTEVHDEEKLHIEEGGEKIIDLVEGSIQDEQQIENNSVVTSAEDLEVSLATKSEIDVHVERYQHIDQGEEESNDLVKESVQEEQQVEIEKKESELCKEEIKEVSTQSKATTEPEFVEKDMNVEDRVEEIVKLSAERKIIIKESVPVVQHEIIIKDDVVEIVSVPDIKDLVSENTETLIKIDQEEERNINVDTMLKKIDDDSIEQNLIEDIISDDKNIAQQTDTKTLQYEKVDVESSNENTNLTTDTTEHQTLCVSGSISNNNQQSSVTFIIDGNNLHGKMFNKNIKIIVKDFIIVEENVDSNDENQTPILLDNHLPKESKIIESEDSTIQVQSIDENNDLVEESAPIIEKENIDHVVEGKTEEDFTAETQVPEADTTEKEDNGNTNLEEKNEVSTKTITESSLLPVEKEINIEDREEKIVELSADISTENQISEKESSEESMEEKHTEEENINDSIEGSRQDEQQVGIKKEESELCKEELKEVSTEATTECEEGIKECIEVGDEVMREELVEMGNETLKEERSTDIVEEKNLIVELNIPDNAEVAIEVTERQEAANENVDHTNLVTTENEVDTNAKEDDDLIHQGEKIDEAEAKPQKDIYDEGYTSEKSMDEPDEDQSISEDVGSDEMVEASFKIQGVQPLQPVPVHQLSSVPGATIKIPFKDIQIDSLATNLSLGGSHVKFEIFSHMRIKPVIKAPPQTNIVWKRTGGEEM